MSSQTQIGQNDGKRDSQEEASAGFPPVARPDARVLVLGSLPGRRSLQAAQYYAHPQNSFWKIMRELTGAKGTYEQRCTTVSDYGIALWDVLASSVRSGSMDADIKLDTAKANDFKDFLTIHAEIKLICFNGQKAAQMFRNLVALDQKETAWRFETLPSTSAAYASMSYVDKLAAWRSVIA